MFSLLCCANALATRIPGVTVNGSQKDATLNYFMPFRVTGHPQDPSRTLAFFTHTAGGYGIVRKVIPYTSAQVCMNQTMLKALKSFGASHPVLIRPGVNVQATDTTAPWGPGNAQKPITFGVCGRTYKGGHKGEWLVTKMVEAGYTVRAHGHGWPVNTKTGSDLTDFYAGIDYLVVTGRIEGGPLPVIEAIAAGVPVIAPNVGWCWEFPVIHYETNDWDSLNTVLHGLTHTPSWDAWAEGHRILFEELK